VRQWIKSAHGVQNATSNPQCITRFKELGRTITRTTDGGADSLDKEQLLMFLMEQDAPGNDLAQALLNLRRGEKFVGPYFSNFEKLADSNDRVHPTIWPVGTRTARMSITEPALQTLPRKDPTIRDAFIPSDGNSLIAIDADQIEMRLAAHFSGDTGLRDAFVLSDKDFFTTVASEAYMEEIDKSDSRRQLMKNALYAVLYGAGHPKIALTAGVPVQQIDIVMAHFHNRFPGIRNLQAAVERVAKERGADGGRPYVTTPTGRRMPGDKGKEYSLINYLIQSHAAEVLKRGICELNAVGLGEYIILPVHDELVLDAPNENLDEIVHTLTETLNSVGTDYLVPLTWGADVMSDRWGTKYRAKV
jgi:DNA polymerase I